MARSFYSMVKWWWLDFLWRKASWGVYGEIKNTQWIKAFEKVFLRIYKRPIPNGHRNIFFPLPDDSYFSDFTRSVPTIVQRSNSIAQKSIATKRSASAPLTRGKPTAAASLYDSFIGATFCKLGHVVASIGHLAIEYTQCTSLAFASLTHTWK